MSPRCKKLCDRQTKYVERETKWLYQHLTKSTHTSYKSWAKNEQRISEDECVDTSEVSLARYPLEWGQSSSLARARQLQNVQILLLKKKKTRRRS